MSTAPPPASFAVPHPLPLAHPTAAPAASSEPEVPEALDPAALLPFLQAVPDPRQASGRRYSLTALLILCFVGLCRGSKGYLSIARWGRKLPAATLQQLGFRRGKSPCAGTLANLLERLDAEQFAAALRQWAEATLALHLPPPEPGPAAPAPAGAPPVVIALDGKTLRGSRTVGAEIAHIVSAVVQHLGLSLTDAGVSSKTNELTALPPVVEQLAAPGRVFTGDALLTQRSLCAQIVAAQSDYVLVVKGNQPTLLAEVQAALAPQHFQDQQRQSVETVNRGHGRVESRLLVLATVAEGSGGGQVAWPGVAQVFYLERITRRKKKGSQQYTVHQEQVYGLTSLGRDTAGAAAVLGMQRGHWSIENRLHYVLDTFFDEDGRHIKKARVARVMGMLRRGALTLLRRLGKRSIPEASDCVAADLNILLPLIGILPEN